MTEMDIRGTAIALLNAVENHIVSDCPPQQQAEAQVFVRGAGGLLIQALVDLNRIAGALEQIALNGHPKRV